MTPKRTDSHGPSRDMFERQFEEEEAERRPTRRANEAH